jgi:2-polyprenyl-6-methoxyphenol hydroxylase-like FAD-dependent oxidoreductase
MQQVVIIGAGLSGLTLALYLSKYNISCAIYEARSKDFSAGGNIALSPNALRVLDHIGVYESLRTQGFAFDEVAFLNGRGGHLAWVLNGSYEAYNFPALRINRAAIRTTLIGELNRIGVPIYYEKKVTGISGETADSASVEFADGETVTAQHIVGAEGIHSRVRKYVRPDAHPEFQDLAGISGTFKLSELKDVDNKLALPCFLFGGDGSFAIMPASADGDTVSYFGTFELPDRSREEWEALDNDKAEMDRMLKDRYKPNSSWPPVVRALCHQAPKDELTLWPFYQVRAGTTWSSAKKRVILIGDAAHAMPPSGGQGGATSFEDAETLGYAFAHIYSKDFDMSARAEAISAWEGHRIPRIERIQQYNNRNGNLRKTAPTFAHQLYKETMIWAYINYITGPKMGVEWIYGYDGESVRGALGTIGRPKPGVTKKEKRN